MFLCSCSGILESYTLRYTAALDSQVYRACYGSWPYLDTVAGLSSILHYTFFDHVTACIVISYESARTPHYNHFQAQASFTMTAHTPDKYEMAEHEEASSTVCKIEPSSLKY